MSKRFVIREARMFDVVDLEQRLDDPAQPYKDGVVVLNTRDRAAAEQTVRDYETAFGETARVSSRAKSRRRR